MRGGPRPGSGRKPGSPNRRTREVAVKAKALGITPLEVMLKTMWALWEKAQVLPFDLNSAKEAMAVADRAAPYCHPRISSVDPKPTEQPIGKEFDIRDTAKRMVFLLRAGEHEIEKERQPRLELAKKKKVVTA